MNGIEGWASANCGLGDSCGEEGDFGEVGEGGGCEWEEVGG